MMDFFRSLFGMKEEAPKRTVVGARVDFGIQEVEFIKDSNKRLSQLQELARRYEGTPQALKIKAVYDKTKSIHSFLVSRKKVHALEVFHLQNTDHFISTFTVILDVHEKHSTHAQGSVPPNPIHQQKPRIPRADKVLHLPDMIKPPHAQGPFYQSTESRTPVPRLVVPDISINTFEKVTFLHENAAGQLVTHHVAFTSGKEEKEAFLHHISSRLGLENISYVGNSHLTIPNGNGITPTGIVPVIHWEGFLYAVNLNDYRLFPVRIYRK